MSSVFKLFDYYFNKEEKIRFRFASNIIYYNIIWILFEFLPRFIIVICFAPTYLHAADNDSAARRRMRNTFYRRRFVHAHTHNINITLLLPWYDNIIICDSWSNILLVTSHGGRNAWTTRRIGSEIYSWPRQRRVMRVLFAGVTRVLRGPIIIVIVVANTKPYVRRLTVHAHRTSRCHRYYRVLLYFVFFFFIRPRTPGHDERDRGRA